ncbi:DUF2142 domain-containing protein [Cellulosimicrobium sp. Marseille-Q4280]|uniref:DUF2142 domain-containing protein n=1 Tax=Cellulosimicrobium sp. Marseille-Q4280 TaxID=2937992 RepID=UPI00203FCDFB|nr:DUF2142 domain-containing protein [Cellulosimicrobium sp. Marseille-Q4280]
MTQTTVSAPAAPATPGTPAWVERVFTARRSTPRAAFWSAFVALFAVSALWAVSNPLMASVDEPAHVVKAAATVRGAEDLSPDGAENGIGVVELPNLYLQLSLYPNCFAFDPDQPASCQPDLSGDIDTPTPVQTSAINYNPLYYAIVGLPSLLPGGGEHTVLLMRLVNAALASLVLALAVRTIVELRTRRWLGLALLLPVTPTVVNLLGSVNPQSIEVTGAALLWVALLALLHSPDAALTPRRLVRVGIAALLLANARSLGPFFAALIVVLCVASVPWSTLREVFRDRRLWWGVAAGVAACAVGTAWIFGASAVPDGGGSGIPLRDAVTFTLGNTSAYVQQLISALGWLDVAVPVWLYLLAAATIGFVVFLAWALGRSRDRLLLAGLALVVFALPIAFQAAQAQSIGFFWQGRYIFPLSVGFVLLAGLVVSRAADVLPGWLHTNLLATLGVGLVAVNVAAFAVNMHRYVNGAAGGWFSTDADSWAPVAHPLVLAALYTAAWAALVVVVLRATSGDDRRRALTSAETSDR